MQLAGFTGFKPGSNGFFIIPDTGVSIYVPRATIDPTDSYSELVELLSVAIEANNNPNGG